MTEENILELFQNKRNIGSYVNISAPMVRYSKLQFRTLLRRYNVGLCYTPMIIADSFCNSDEARQNEFTTSRDDSPLIAQFAAKNSVDLLTATELIYPYVDGVDLNCGCPQKWAIADGYGCALLKQPDLLYDMIQTLRRNLPSNFSISVKMRIVDKTISSTVEMCRRLERCGVTFLSIHGRRPGQKSSEAVDINAMAEIKKSLFVPFIVNGDVKSVTNADEIHRATKCDGVMVARGLLTNPAMFTGSNITPKKCIQDWVNLAYAAGDKITFQCFHHHLTFMMEKKIEKSLRVKFNNLSNKDEIFKFLVDVFHIEPQWDIPLPNYLACKYNADLYKCRQIIGCGTYNYEELKAACLRKGKFFEEFQNLESTDADDWDNLEFMGSSIFNL